MICKTCGVDKPLEAFSTTDRTKLGRVLHCKPCTVQKAMAWRRANPEKYLATHRKAKRKFILKKSFGLTPEQYQAMHDA
jgi:hypothetical protein